MNHTIVIIKPLNFNVSWDMWDTNRPGTFGTQADQGHVGHKQNQQYQMANRNETYLSIYLYV